MTALSGSQAFWRGKESELAPVAQICPCCARPMPLRGSVLDQAYEVAEAVFGTSRAAIMSSSRTARISDARALVVWAVRTIDGRLSYDAIGRIMGGRHHSSIINLHQKAISLRVRNVQFANACAEVAARAQGMGGSHASN